MQFISNGDFLFPFGWRLYAAQQFYVWSYQTGAANPSGIIRMPGRLIDLLAFMLFGNVGFGYFYLFSSIIIVFISFLIFERQLLRIKSVTIQTLGALFFAVNPIFLGNLAKVGLVFAAAMLPLCLVALKMAFEKRQYRYFLAWVVLLNISLIHPYTFTVNLVASLSYFVWLALHHKDFMRQSVRPFLVIAGVALLLNAYFILPQASMRTISKNVLSSTISSTPVDYTALVDVSNTGDIFTGLSLSKNILKDFDFYNPLYMNFYFLGAFLLYALIFGAYVRVERRMSNRNRQRFVLCLAIFLLLVLLATVKFMHMDALIRMLISLPGGWAFRSPLKWQLYIPLVLFSMLALVLQEIRRRRFRATAYAGVVLAFLLLNGYIAVDVYHKILTPRQVHTFSALQTAGLDHQNLLLISSPACMTYEEDNPTIFTELNQVLISHNVQVKQIASDDVGLVNLGNYRFVMDCQQSLRQTLARSYDFAPVADFDEGNYTLYQNRAPPEYVRAASALYQMPATLSGDVGSKYDFVHQQLGQPFAFTPRAASDIPTTGLQDVFEGLTFADAQPGQLQTLVTPTHAGAQTLYIKSDGAPLYYKTDSDAVALSATRQKGYQAFAKQALNSIDLNVPAGQTLRVSYGDPGFAAQNLIPNAALKDGLWQHKVNDCYAHDSGADVQMKQVRGEAGGQALQLAAGADIACSGPGEVAVTPGQHYLFGFDFQTLGGQYAGYNVTFDDAGSTSFGGRLTASKPNVWQSFTKGFVAPPGAQHMRLLLYAYSDSSGLKTGAAQYDDFQLSAIPDVLERFYLASKPAADLTAPDLTVATQNPTLATVRVANARTPFFVITRESYSPQWQLALKNGAALANTDHLNVDGSMNGWFVDPAALCKISKDCQHNADGSYAFSLSMVYAPQRWFYVGTTVSALTAVGVVVYLVRPAWLPFTRRAKDA